LSLTETVPTNALPGTFGAKVMLMVQDFPAATLDPQSLVCE
jgi:hypothetical protein